MASNRNLLVLPGDGIGPEVMNEVRKIIAWMGKKRAVGFDIKEDLVGGAALDKHGVPLSDDAMKTALEADAVLFGSVGGPKWDTADFSKKPERGLLRLRKEMDLFANLRPAKVFDALVDASSLKPEIVKGLDIMIIRELTSGVYFGEPRGRHINAQGERRGVRHAALHGAGNPPRLRRRLRTGAQAQEQGALGREGQRHAHRRAVARGSDQAAQGEIRRRGAQPHVCRRARHAAAALATRFRRHRHRQSVRRHPLR